MAILDTISAMSDNIKSCYNIVRINGGLIPENKNIENLPMAINSMFFDRTQTTHYTQEDVDNSEGTLIPIGKTKPLYVIAALTDSGATCTITRNGDNSDGIIADYDNKDNKSPFYESSVVNLIFKSGIFYIGNYLFTQSYSIQTIEFSNTIDTIGSYAFQMCGGNSDETAIPYIFLPKNVTRLKDGAFAGLRVKNFELEDQSTLVECYFYSLLFNNNIKYTGTIYYPDAIKGSIKILTYKYATGIYIGKGIKVIEGSSAASFGQLGTGTGELILQEGLEQIGESGLFGQAFNHATKFTNTTLRLPSTLKKLGDNHLFYDFATKSLERVEVPESSQYFKTVDGVLYSKDMSRLILYPPMKSDTFYKMPDTVTEINSLGFSRNGMLQSMELSDNYIIRLITILGADITNLSYSLYMFLTSLTSVTVSENNTRYKSVNGMIYTKDGKRFLYCGPGVTEVHIEDGCESVATASIGAISDTSVYWSIPSYNHLRVKVYLPASVSSVVSQYVTGDLVKYLDFYVDENNPYYTTEEVSDSYGNYHKLVRK